ncbi:MAG: hypothetical protein H0U74_18675 [Bradymonadaceae bacterium]|nr:hypothetical protein [Lujinxingiaceae bacterium]
MNLLLIALTTASVTLFATTAGASEPAAALVGLHASLVPTKGWSSCTASRAEALAQMPEREVGAKAQAKTLLDTPLVAMVVSFDPALDFNELRVAAATPKRGMALLNQAPALSLDLSGGGEENAQSQVRFSATWFEIFTVRNEMARQRSRRIEGLTVLLDPFENPDLDDSVVAYRRTFSIALPFDLLRLDFIAETRRPQGGQEMADVAARDHRFSANLALAY